MNAPVTATVPGGRPAAARASESGRAHSAAPFASTLDCVLSESRPSDRGIPDRAETAERSGHRDPERDQWPAGRSDAAAARRVADETHRAEARTGRAAAQTADETHRLEGRTERAAATADETHRLEARADRAAAKAAGEHGAEDTQPPAAPVDGETPPEGAAAPAAPVAGEEPAPAPEPPRGGLPALWALLMGGSLASPPTVDAEAGGAAPSGGLPIAPLAPAAAPVPVAAPADPVPGLPAAPAPGTAVPAASVADAVGAAAAPAAQAAVSAGQAAEALPAGFVAALADAIGAPAGTAATPVTTPAPVPVTAATPAAPAVPVDVAPEATPATAPTLLPAAPPVPPAGATAPQDGTTADAGGAAPATDAVVTPAGQSGQALSADAGGAGQDGADGAPAGVGATGPTVGPAAPVATPGTAAVADVDGATGGAAALPVGAQVARQVAVLAGGPDGEHSMTLVLTPDTLGEVQVQVTLTKGAIELALRGAHEQGRAALLEALPELRRDLEAAGLNPSRLEVARETGSSLLDRQPTQQQGFGERGGSHDRGENRSRPGGRPADTGGSGSASPNRSTSSGVDVRV
jgi:flagellar hook-length control protein FliK